MELKVIRQKKNHNKLSLSMSTHVTEFEHDLAHHIEIVKSNVEGEVSVTKQNQKQIKFLQKKLPIKIQLSIQKSKTSRKILTN